MSGAHNGRGPGAHPWWGPGLEFFTTLNAVGGLICILFYLYFWKVHNKFSLQLIKKDHISNIKLTDASFLPSDDQYLREGDLGTAQFLVSLRHC